MVWKERGRGLVLFSLALAASLLIAQQALGELLFEEDFSSLDDWYLVVYNSAGGSEAAPPPVLDVSTGFPAPSLNPNGDGWCGNGAYTKQNFGYSQGLILSWDMIVGSGFDWNWGMVGIADHLPNLSNQREDGAYIDNGLCDPSYVAGISFIDDANYDQRPPHMSFGFKAEDGTIEGFLIDPATEFCNIWINYKIEITPEGYVNFYKDGELIYQSEKRIKPDYGTMPVLAGSRCYDAIVRIDNIKVESIELPADDDTDDDTDDDIDDDIDDDADDDIDDDISDDDVGADGRDTSPRSVGGCGCS